MTTAGPAPATVESPSITRQALFSLALALAVLTAVLLLPALEPVRERFAGTNGFWVAAALGLQVLSTLSFVVAFRGAFERQIGWRAAFDLAMVEEGTNVILPSGGSGGLAVGAVLLIRAGVPTRFAVSRSGVLFLATSAVGLIALMLAGVGEATGLLPGDASLGLTLGPAIVAAVVMVGAVVLSHRIPEISARPDQRLRSLARRTQRFIREAVDISIALIRGGDALLIGGSVGYFAFDVASLGASFAALGGGALPLGLFVLAYVIGHGGAMIPIPGSAEGGLVGAFTLFGSPLSLAVGAVLVYRTFHAGVPMTLAIVGLADIRKLRREGPAPEVIAKRFGDA